VYSFEYAVKDIGCGYNLADLSSKTKPQRTHENRVNDEPNADFEALLD
jgi:hypothetical protein